MDTCLLEKYHTNNTHLTNTLIYEQPLNESLRLFLHLELLFNEFNRHVHADCKNKILESVQHLVRILYTIDRPDLKTKLTHTLTQLTSTLAQLQAFPQVDTLKLNSLLGELDKNIHFLLSNHSKIGDSLKHNELISQIKKLDFLLEYFRNEKKQIKVKYAIIPKQIIHFKPLSKYDK